MWLAEYLDRRGDLIWCHPPNGGWRHKAEAAKFERMGVKRGVPDALIFEPFGIQDVSKATDGEHEGTIWAQVGLAVELKRPAGPGVTAGTTSPEQEWWHKRLRERGWMVAVCWSWTEAQAIIEQCYGPPGSRPAVGWL